MTTVAWSGILSQHVAVLGKTGSGKTSTAKLAIEQVVAEGARVCILDPIKSDWWGLTSSTDGKRAGLPFHILGGPRGHVPLHASAGKAIGEIVASGALPLSIVDMADFEPGGQAKFFVDFAPTLLRKMRGVVYLVIEEAHLFAPKERSGVGAENLSIHWAKTLATAGRSKGIRLVLVTQRTQALHNALLGSCDTLIAHRLTAPADQEPVVKWLKANTSKDVLDKVSSTLASLKTGDGWICSGEAKVFDLVHFPRIHTYDNTATPTGDGDARVIKTAAVDQEKLRAIIGDAVEQAKADDPRELRKQIAELKAQISKVTISSNRPNSLTKTVDKPVLNDVDRALLARFEDKLAQAASDLGENAALIVEKALIKVASLFEDRRRVFIDSLESKGFQKILGKLSAISYQSQPAGRRDESPSRATPSPVHRADLGSRVRPSLSAAPNRPASLVSPSKESNGNLSRAAERRALTALVQYPEGRSMRQVAILAGYAMNGGGFRNALGRLRALGYVEGSGDRLRATDAGVAALGEVEPLPTGAALADHWLRQLDRKAEREILTVLLDAYPTALAIDEIAKQTPTQYEPNGGGFRNALGKLRTLELIDGRGELRASEELFS